MFIVTLCTVALAFQQDTPASQRENDVYNIYSLLLTDPRVSQAAANSRYLIAERTGAQMVQEPCVQPPKQRAAQYKEVAADFEARKATPRILKRQLSLPKPYELLTHEQVLEFQRERTPRPNAPAPDARFEGVSDVFFLSNVYFSKDGKLAMTSVTSWCGSLCAHQEWKVLEKLDSGVWKEQPWTTCIIVARAD